MDEEPGAGLWQSAYARILAGARSFVIDRVAGDFLWLLPAGAAVVGADGIVGADSVAILSPGGAVEFSFLGLRFNGLWLAAVFVAAGAKLDSSHAQETGSLEGQELRELTSVKRYLSLRHLIRRQITS